MPSNFRDSRGFVVIRELGPGHILAIRVGNVSIRELSGHNEDIGARFEASEITCIAQAVARLVTYGFRVVFGLNS